MKQRIRAWMYKWSGTVGALCLGLTMFLHRRGMCLFFFGEYPFPKE